MLIESQRDQEQSITKDKGEGKISKVPSIETDIDHQGLLPWWGEPPRTPKAMILGFGGGGKGRE